MSRPMTYDDYAKLKDDINRKQDEVMSDIENLKDSLNQLTENMDWWKGNDTFPNTNLNKMFNHGVLPGKRFKFKGEEMEVVGYTDSLDIVVKNIKTGQTFNGANVNRLKDEHIQMFEITPSDIAAEWEAKEENGCWKMHDKDGNSVGVFCDNKEIAIFLAACKPMYRVLKEILENWNGIENTGYRDAILGIIDMVEGRMTTIQPYQRKEEN